jgi:glycosyltransferase involved in cell wall biosynthesis
MLERIAGDDAPAWRYAASWTKRLRCWAQRCDRLVVAPGSVERAVSVLGVERERVVTVANGVDVELFQATEVDREAFWRRALIEQPRGWLAGRPAGSARYREAEVTALARGPILVYVGRFTAVKRLDRLISAFGEAQQRLATPAGLVLVGGHPGEYEGQHPAEVAARLGVPQVFLAGWHTHEELPAFFAAADAVVLTSEREQFGQVIVEGMACGLPALATRSLGPTAVISDGETGWLVDRDDQPGLVSALIDVVSDPEERRRRGELARIVARERYSWTAAAELLATVLTDVIALSGAAVGDQSGRPPGARIANSSPIG